MELGFPGPTWWQPRDGSWVWVKGWSRLMLRKVKVLQPRDVHTGAFLDVSLFPKEQQPPMTFREVLGWK